MLLMFAFLLVYGLGVVCFAIYGFLLRGRFAVACC